MKAAVLTGSRRCKVADVSVDEIGPGQVLLELEGCGVCASSLPVWEGRTWFDYPLQAGAPGHEPWGRVAALGAGVHGLAIGQRVTGLSYRAYAEYDIANAMDVVPLPAALDNRPFPGEAFACVMNIFSRARIREDMTVAVIGAGFIGSSLVQLAAAAGARVTAFSRRGFSLDLALAQGAEDARLLDARQPDAGAWERVIECTGTQAGLDLATELAAQGGRVVIAGYHQDGPRTVDMQVWNWKGIDVINAHERVAARYCDGIVAALAAIEAGRFDPWPLLTHSFALDDTAAAFRMLEERPDGFVKALVSM